MLFRGDYDEKRDFARMGVECPATMRIEGEGRVCHARVTELSASGMRLIGTEMLPVGTVVQVEMTPERTIVPPLQAKAEVVRCAQEGSGDYLLGLKILEMLPG